MAIDLQIGTRARVTVPGSSANLGPGFDTLGICLLYTSDAADETLWV